MKPAVGLWFLALCGAGWAEPLELIADRHFQGALEVWGPVQGAIVVQDVLRRPGVTGNPTWQIAQWDSHFSLAGATPEALPSGAIRFADTSKTVIVGPTTTTDADLVLAMDSREEYGAEPREAGEPWPDLLIQQEFGSPGAWLSPPLTEMHALMFRVDALLRYFERFEPPGYTPGLHAAQFQIYFTVQNLNSNSPGYGDFLWLGMPIFDDRDPSPPLTVIQTDATLKLIYLIGQSSLTEASLHDGTWVTFQADLLPIAIDALEKAWELGFLPGSQNPSDYRIGAMNMGWEMPGTNNTAVQVRNLSLRAIFPGDFDSMAIRTNFTPGFVEEGMRIDMEAPETVAIPPQYQWKKDGLDLTGANSRTLVLDSVAAEDSGAYSVSFENGMSKAIVETPPVQLDVLPQGTLPVGAGALLMLTALFLVVGTATNRRPHQ